MHRHEIRRCSVPAYMHLKHVGVCTCTHMLHVGVICMCLCIRIDMCTYCTCIETHTHTYVQAAAKVMLMRSVTQLMPAIEEANPRLLIHVHNCAQTYMLLRCDFALLDLT